MSHTDTIMMDVDHNLSSALVKIAENLRERDVSYLKFLCHDILPAGEIEKHNGLNIIDALSNYHIITSNDYKFLLKCLKKIHRIDLLKILNSGSSNIDDFEPNELNPFRSLLFDLALDLRSEDVKKLRFFYRSHIKENNIDALSIFTILLDADVINERSFGSLVNTLSSINRKDLASKLEEYCRPPVEQRRGPIPESCGREGPRRCSPSEESSCREYRMGILETQISATPSNRMGILETQISATPSSPKIQPESQQSLSSEITVYNAHPTFINKSKRRSVDCYRMESVPRGYCVIINNIEFAGGSQRLGAKVDEDELQKLFEKFQFTVKIHKNLSSNEMKECLKKYRNENHKLYDCFACFILSHGAKDEVFGSDSKPVVINDLIELFNTDKCPSLENKPKLFFIQACQNENDQKDCSFDAMGPSVHYQNPVLKADVSVFMSTIAGYYSYRCPQNGCRFIKHITEEFSTNAEEKHLLEMITSVINSVSDEG
ncbi:caspase-8 isoform X3 [Octopus sinensis]|uniref:Caspase-8 isoform X3 n=1 Tax=Octopus sinensis TaxID=2607531 RepID=A0A7E6FK87_9MOLL|nr:caspase-8 isoform X3 [Octopus sinensis]